MRNPRCFGRGEFASTTRCPSSGQTYPTSPSHRQEAEKGPLLHPLDTVPQLRSLLELLVVDRSPQPLAQLAQHCRPLDRLALRRAIGTPDMAGMPMNTPQQLADTVLELRVTARASPATGRAEV